MYCTTYNTIIAAEIPTVAVHGISALIVSPLSLVSMTIRYNEPCKRQDDR